MRRKLLARRPSPAMVVAFIALCVGVTGGAFAAATIDGGDIVNGSITKKDLHKNSVNTKKVKNKTLKANDFAPGQLEQGVQGIQGLKGEKGEKGDTGPIGPSTGLGERNDTTIPWSSNPQTLVSLGSVPAGSYVVNGKVFANNNGASSALVQCDLLVGEEVVDDGDVVRLGINDQPAERLYLVQAATVTLDGVGLIAIQCDAPNTGGSWGNSVLTAVKVGELG